MLAATRVARACAEEPDPKGGQSKTRKTEGNLADGDSADGDAADGDAADGDAASKYTIGKTLGHGAFATVKLCERNGRPFAMKLVDKRRTTPELAQRELAILGAAAYRSARRTQRLHVV